MKRTLVVPLPRASAAVEKAAYAMSGLRSRVCFVRLSDLVKIQRSVFISNLEELRRVRKRPPIWVARVGRRLVILDGHHRTVLSIQAGRKRIRARLYEAPVMSEKAPR